MTNDPCREAFEKWYSAYDPKDFARGTSSWVIESAYIAWQAAWNARTIRAPLIIRDSFLRGFPNIPKNAKPATEHNPADTSQNVEYE